MANTANEILLTVGARNNASSVLGQVDKDAKNMASSISSAMSSINQGMMNIGQVTDNVMQGLTGKSAMDNIFGTTSKAETNTVLLKNMLDDTEKNFDSFYETVDKTTDSSLTSMQELIPALKAFKSATGATDKEMTNITDEMANFGAAVLAQTGSTDLAQQSMMDLSKGVKGAFASLDQYGITQDALERTGYWNGDEKDVEGFMKAVQEVTGSTEELMETNTGLDALIGKAFSRAGKKIGNEFLPQLKDIKRGFLELDESLGGNLTASMLAVSGGVEVMNQGFWNISTTVQGVRDLSDAFSTLTGFIKGTEDAAKGASGALEAAGNLSNIVTVGSDISSGAEMIEMATPTIQYAEGATDLLPEDWGLSDHIKESFSKEGKKVSQAVDEGGNSLQKCLKKMSDVPSKISESFHSFSDSLHNIKDDGIKGNFKKIDKKLFDVFKGTDDIADALDVVDDVGDISKDLKGAENIAEGVEGLAGAGGAMTAAGPEMEAAAAGGAAVEAGATGLAATFTSLMVPLLAVSAAIIIMIPIIAVIAAEAMIFIRLLADFMEALNFDSINLDGAINGISQVATALAWVGVAMAAMSFASIMTGIAVITGGFLGITGPLDVAVNAIREVGEKLSQFNTLTINPSVATNLQTISDSLMAVSSAMGALTWTNITTGFSDWIAGALGFRSVTDGLEQAKNDIIEASSKLQELSSMPPLDESVAENIQNVCDSLASVGNAMEALRSIRDGQNWDDMIGSFIGGIFGEGVDIQTALTDVKDDIYDAATALSGWDLPDIDENGELGDKIKKVSDALTSVNDAFQTLRGFRDDNVWDDMIGGLFGETDISTALDEIMTDINTAATKLGELKIDDETINDELITGIKNIVSALTEVTNAANGLTALPPMEDFNTENLDSVMSNVQKAADGISGLNIGEVNEDVITNIKNVAGALTEISGVMTTLTTLPPMDGFDSSIITSAVTNVQTAATELSKLSGITVGEDVNGVLGSINTALQTLKDTLANASGFTEVSVNIGSQIVSGVQSGLSPLTSEITGAVSSATNSSASAGWTGGAYIGQSTTGGLKSALQLKSTMETEVSYTLQAMTSKTQEFYNAGQALGKAANEGFQSQPAINPGSPGNLANVMIDEVGYILSAMKGNYSNAYNMASSLGESIYSGFGNPSLDVGMNKHRISVDDLSSMDRIVSQAPRGNNSKTIIMYNNVTVDARNKTEKEAQSILTLALEGMDHITNIDVDV